MATLATGLIYGAVQTARVGFFLTNRIASSRITGPVIEPGTWPADAPDLKTVMRDIARLMRRDCRHIDRGIYRLPEELIEGPSSVVARALDYYADIPTVHRRRREKAHQEVRGSAADAESYPRYYLQNFHFQSDGYLSGDSARRYDFQVDTLFLGAADAMRRQALVPLAEIFRPAREGARFADVGCGTGRFLRSFARNFPRVVATGVDLSPNYIDLARRHCRRYPNVGFEVGNMENLSFEDRSLDAVSSIFTFHELPQKARANVAAEIARVLKPGGRYVHLETLQLGDYPAYDSLLEVFPRAFHEPYYQDYISSDLGALFGAAGLELRSEKRAFLSKVSVFERPR